MPVFSMKGQGKIGTFQKKVRGKFDYSYGELEASKGQIYIIKVVTIGHKVLFIIFFHQISPLLCPGPISMLSCHFMRRGGCQGKVITFPHNGSYDKIEKMAFFDSFRLIDT